MKWPVRTRCGALLATAAVLAGLMACSAPSRSLTLAGATPSGPLTGPGARESAAPSTGSSPKTPATRLPRGLTQADVQAGLLSATFRSAGGGTLLTVPGNVKAPSSSGRLVRVRVQVEKGLNVNGQRFAAFVMRTLNDPRSWGHGGRAHFARVDVDSDIRVVLASPDTSAHMCLPLRTFGRLSCHSGDAAVMTIYRWVKAIPDYGSDRTGYRRYLINHEVGHALGHGHEYCPGKGRIAPVMQQQTKGMQGCQVNPWPYP